jgi:hypothetical protein
MLLIGVDYHPSFQQIAFFEEETGECGERQLHHKAVLPRPAATRNSRACGHGGYRIFSLV